MDNLERQRQIESDSVRDGCVGWAGNIDHQQAYTRCEEFGGRLEMSMR